MWQVQQVYKRCKTQKPLRNAIPPRAEHRLNRSRIWPPPTPTPTLSEAESDLRLRLRLDPTPLRLRLRLVGAKSELGFLLGFFIGPFFRLFSLTQLTFQFYNLQL